MEMFSRFWGGFLLQYFMPVRSPSGDTYSIDKVILDFKLRYQSGGDWADRFLLFLNLDMSVFFEHWTTFKVGAFREQFTFDCGDSNSFWAGVGLNDGTGRVLNRVRLEFNPNKVIENYIFTNVFNHLFSLSIGPPGIVRFDLAVDFPVLRSDCFLLKDQRMYEEYRKSKEDRTQYLGVRNKPGRCKLYNKALEAGLGYPLSRLELTISGETMSYQNVLSIWPRVLIWDDYQLLFDDLFLNDTDRCLLKAMILDPQLIEELGRVKRKKIECILERYTRFLEIDRTTYEKIITQLYVYSQHIPCWGNEKDGKI